MEDPVTGIADAGSTAVADAGATSEIETPSTDTAPGGEPGGTGEVSGGDRDSAPASEIESAEPSEGEAQPEGEGEPDTEGFDGRMVDDKTRKALAALKKVDPASAKLLSDTYHRTARIMKDVGAQNLSEAVNKVAAMSATLESVGGAEGLMALNDEVEGFRTETTQFANGDIELPRALYKENPQGLIRSIKASLQVVAEANAEHFKEAIMDSVVERLDQAGMYNSIPALLKLIEEGKGPEAYQLTQNIDKWLNDAKSLREKALKVKAEKDPEREKFDKERQEFEQQKAQAYTDQIGATVNRMNNSAMSRVVEPFFKELRLTDPAGRADFVDVLQNSIWKAMRDDKTFQMQAKAIKARGDAHATAEFFNQKFRELLPVHFRAKRNALYPSYATRKVTPITNGNGKPAAAKPAVAAAAGTGPTQITGRPRHEDVDWGKTQTIDYIKGLAVLKNGRSVKFDINAAPNKL